MKQMLVYDASCNCQMLTCILGAVVNDNHHVLERRYLFLLLVKFLLQLLVFVYLPAEEIQ